MPPAVLKIAALDFVASNITFGCLYGLCQASADKWWRSFSVNEFYTVPLEIFSTNLLNLFCIPTCPKLHTVLQFTCWCALLEWNHDHARHRLETAFSPFAPRKWNALDPTIKKSDSVRHSKQPPQHMCSRLSSTSKTTIICKSFLNISNGSYISDIYYYYCCCWSCWRAHITVVMIFFLLSAGNSLGMDTCNKSHYLHTLCQTNSLVTVDNIYFISRSKF